MDGECIITYDRQRSALLWGDTVGSQFSRLYLLTWSSSIWSRPWVHVMQTHWLTAHWLPYPPFIDAMASKKDGRKLSSLSKWPVNWVCVNHKSSHIITLTLCNRSFTRWSRNSISISDLLLLSLHSKFPLEARSSKTSLIPSTGSLLFICPLLNNSKSWADARSIVVTELTYDKIKISNLKNKNM